MTRFFRLCFEVAKNTVRLWVEGQVFVSAAALAFFTLFSVAPVMIVAVAIVGLVLGEDAAHGQVAAQLQAAIGPEAAAAVQTAVASSRVEHSGVLPTVLGVGAMLFGATTVFAQMQRALNAIWGVVPRPTRSGVLLFVKSRVLSLAVVVAIGFVLLVSLLLSVAMRTIMVFAQDWLPLPPGVMVAVDAGVSLGVVTLLFATIFRVLPDVVLDWRDVLLGALMTAVLFTVGRAAIALYLANTATASTYGAAGSLVMLLLWVNYSSLILLFGAAFTRALREARGLPIRPRNSAVCVHTELVENGDAAPGRRDTTTTAATPPEAEGGQGARP